MDILDSDGRLFGHVNVVDALVVLCVVAVLAAGGALVIGSGAQSGSTSSDFDSQYATVTIGPLSEDTATALAEANNLTVVGSETSLEVVDSVRTPHPTRDAAFAVVRVRVPDDPEAATLNRSFSVTTGQFAYNATVSDFTNESTIERQTSSVVLQTSVPSQVAGDIEPGDTHRIGNETVGTITGVQRLGRQNGQQRLLLALDVSAFRVGGNERFARRPLRLGTTVPFRADAYSLAGTIVSREPANLSSRRVTVQAETTVSGTVAVKPGDEFTIDSTTVATIETVSAIPTGTDSRSRLVMNLTLQTSTFDNGTQFLGRSVRPGTSVPFRTSAYVLQPTIVSLDPSAVQRQTLTTRIQTTVPGTVADNVDRGDTFRINDRTVAEIDTVRAYPVAGSSRQRLVLTVALQTVLDDGTPEFLGSPVRIGSTVPFETPSYEFDGEVVSRNGFTADTAVDATLTVEWEDVRPELANAVSPGMAESHRGADATISDVEYAPATVILRTESGEIYAREHPINEDVTLTVSVTAQKEDGTLSFHGRPVQNGDDVVLDFGSVTVEGTVVGLSVEA